jgi:hypothetical protein
VDSGTRRHDHGNLVSSEQPHERATDPTPRRAVERDYLAALADLVPLETWREICRQTVEAARAGDPKARDWLARYLIGDSPMKLLHLAADERAAYSPDDEIDRESKSRQEWRLLSDACSFRGGNGGKNK